MPYSYPDNMPSAIKKLPAHAQEIFVAAYNSAHKQYDGDEAKANATAWAAVKKDYEQVEGKWRKKAMEVFRFIDFLGEVKFSKDGKTSKEVQLFKIGKWKTHPSGEFEITEAAVAEMVKNFGEGDRSLVVDYQHGSLETDPDKAKAAGWVKKLINKGKDGLWGVVEWTERATEYIKNKEYLFLSPEFHTNYPNKETGKKQGYTLLAAGLTNRPFFDGMAQVACSERVLAEIDKVSLDEILSDISAWLTKSAPVLKGKKGSPAIRLYLRGVKEKLGGLIKKQGTKSLAEESLDDQVDKIRSAYRKKYVAPYSNISHWVKEVFEAYLIVERDYKLLKIPYTINGDEVEFGEQVEVEEVYQEKKTLTEGGAEMDRKLLCAQLRLSETATDDEITAELKRLGELQGHKKLAESLGLKDQATEQEVLAEIKKLKEAGIQKKGAEDTVKLVDFQRVERESADAKKLAVANKKESDGLKLELLEKKRDSVIEKALKDDNGKCRILPANRKLWEEFYMKDPVAATKMIEALPVVLDLGEKGSAGGTEAGSAGEQLSVKCTEKMAANPKLTYSEALLVVQRENPDMAKECAREAGL